MQYREGEGIERTILANRFALIQHFVHRLETGQIPKNHFVPGKKPSDGQ